MSTTCLYCGKSFVSRHPSQKFCGKTTSGRHLCKDRFHNREQFRAERADPLDAYERYLDTVHHFSSEAFEP